MYSGADVPWKGNRMKATSQNVAIHQPRMMNF